MSNGSSARQRILCLTGPTGAGKSAAALMLAAELGGGIINADSRQVYRDFPVITAQPTAEERGRCAHGLYGFLACDEALSAGKYATLAREKIAAFTAQGLLPIVVGGTGLYLDALFAGIPAMPAVPPALSLHWRQRCAAEGPQALHALLRERDPVCAAKIHPNDSQRITRALEVHDATGTPLSVWQKRPVTPSGLEPLLLGMEMTLDELTPLLEARVSAMLEAGAVAEAKAAFARCPDGRAPGWSGIGCAELFRHITGGVDLDACRRLWVNNTRAYAKRQLTWFRRNPAIVWLRPGAQNAMLEKSRAFLGL